jgi:hypothetical protein
MHESVIPLKNCYPTLQNDRSHKIVTVYARLWENPAKVARKNSEKKGKSKEKQFFLVKMPL